VKKATAVTLPSPSSVFFLWVQLNEESDGNNVVVAFFFSLGAA